MIQYAIVFLWSVYSIYALFFIDLVWIQLWNNSAEDIAITIIIKWIDSLKKLLLFLLKIVINLTKVVKNNQIEKNDNIWFWLVTSRCNSASLAPSSASQSNQGCNQLTSSSTNRNCRKPNKGRTSIQQSGGNPRTDR